MSTFWSVWIIVLTLATIIGSAWLLFANRKGSKDATTGHSYDGIEEYDNPLPAWWLWMFVLSILFGIGYLIAYPGLGNFKGVLGWTQEDRWADKVAEADASFREIVARYADMSIHEIAADRDARNMGRRLFANNCAQCHGADAKGSKGFPNLTDKDWLWGGSFETITETITQGREGNMPPMAAAVGSSEDVRNLAHYVL